MKKLIFALLLILAAHTASGQNKIYNLDKKNDSVNYTKTNDVAIYHGQTLPVYISKNGKIFIFVTSKRTGNQYKKYLN